MRFFEVSSHDLMDARPGLQLVERLLEDEHFTPYVYGMTTDVEILEAAQAAIADDAGRDEEGNPAANVKLSEVAVAIPFSGDILYSLAGSGLLLQHEDFAYISPNEGARTMSFRWAGVRPRVNLKDFTVLALSDDDMYLDEFLKQNATKQQEEAPATVQRTVPQAVKSSRRIPNPIDEFLNNL
jgi:hypothetical protein